MQKNTENYIKLDKVSRIYGTKEVPIKAVDEISFQIEKGEFVVIVGPSGAGKTTVLNILGGMDHATDGEVWVDGRNIAGYNSRQLTAYRRDDIGFVFQFYNLVPNLTALENVELAAQICKNPLDAAQVLEEVGLGDRLGNFPAQLSGGEQQRVSIARALANNPRVLLLDEPLGALDLQLRRTMQLELKRLQKKLGITFIYITHDQEEAINMSDRIVVMNQGQFEQIGTPDEIYNHPKTSYVATFVGNANILKGKVVEINGSYAQVKIGNDTVSVYTEEIVKVGEQLTLAVRSENILLDEAEMENVVEQNEAEGTGRHLYATVKEKNFAAGQLRVLLALSDGTELTASRFGMNANIQPGQQIKWYFDPRNAVVVDREIKTKEPADMSGGNQ